MSYKLDKQKEKLEKALTAYREGKSRLFDESGNRIYAPQEHDRRLQALNAGITEVIAETRVVSAGIVETAKRDMLGTDPLTWLSAKDLQKASTMARFVEEDINNLPFNELVNRAQMVRDDKVLTWLYARYAPQRVEAVRLSIAQEKTKTPDGFGEFMTAVQDLPALAMPADVRTQQEKATRDHEGAVDLSIHAGKVEHELGLRSHFEAKI